MSLFSAQLQVVAGDAGLSRAQLAASAGMPYTTLNNYFIGSRAPDTDAVRAICAALPEDLRAELLAARAADEIPREYRHLLWLTPKGVSLAGEEEPHEYAAGLRAPPEVEANIRRLRAAAIESPEWAAALAALASLTET